MSEEHPIISEERLYFFDRRDILLEDLDAPGFILDIGGGGEGVIGRLKGPAVIAIDPNRRELEEAPDGPLKIVMDAADLKFLDGTFPTVTSFFSLMFIPGSRHRQVFSEIFRVLQPGGRFLVWDVFLPAREVPEKDVAVFRLRIILPQEEIITGYGVPWPEAGRDSEYYRELAAEAGFRVERFEQEDTFVKLVLVKPHES